MGDRRLIQHSLRTVSDRSLRRLARDIVGDDDALAAADRVCEAVPQLTGSQQ